MPYYLPCGCMNRLGTTDDHKTTRSDWTRQVEVLQYTASPSFESGFRVIFIGSWTPSLTCMHHFLEFMLHMIG